MNANIDIKQIKPTLKKLFSRLVRHTTFIATLLVLLAYLVVVWKIGTLATAEPSPTDTDSIQAKVPKVDQNAIKQIQALEQTNTQIHSLFDNARNNPFSE